MFNLIKLLTLTSYGLAIRKCLKWTIMPTTNKKIYTSLALKFEQFFDRGWGFKDAYNIVGCLQHRLPSLLFNEYYRRVCNLFCNPVYPTDEIPTDVKPSKLFKLFGLTEQYFGIRLRFSQSLGLIPKYSLRSSEGFRQLELRRNGSILCNNPKRISKHCVPFTSWLYAQQMPNKRK